MNKEHRPTIDPPIMCEWTNCLHRHGVGPCEYCPLDSTKSANISPRSELQKECDETDALLRHLGLNPEQCRTDGGSLNIARIKTLMTVDRPALAGAQSRLSIAEIVRHAEAIWGKQSKRLPIEAAIQFARAIEAALSAELKPVLYRYWQPSIKRWGYTEDPSMGQPLYAFGEKQ